jgi:hypothetical protein
MKSVGSGVYWLNMRDTHDLVPGDTSHYTDGIVEEKVYNLRDLTASYGMSLVAGHNIWRNGNDSNVARTIYELRFSG